jgi:hypothetical protein
MLGDAGGNQRMRHLEDERAAAAEEQDCLTVDAPGQASGPEQPAIRHRA